MREELWELRIFKTFGEMELRANSRGQNGVGGSHSLFKNG